MTWLRPKAVLLGLGRWVTSFGEMCPETHPKEAWIGIFKPNWENPKNCHISETIIRSVQNLMTNFWPMSIWPNDLMDEDATWYGSRPRPRPHCRGLSNRIPALRERGTATPPYLFGPCLLWPRSPISATAELLYNIKTAKILSVTSRGVDVKRTVHYISPAFDVTEKLFGVK